MPSLGSSPVARARSQRGPVEAQADRGCSAEATRKRPRGAGCERVGGEPVVARAGRHRQHQLRPAARPRRHVDAAGAGPRCGPSGSPSPSAQRRRAEPGQQVGGAAAEHRRRRRRRRRRRGSCARPRWPRPTSSTAPAGTRTARPRRAGRPSTVTGQGAPVTATVTGRRERARAHPVSVGLQGGGVLGVADQPVGQPVGAAGRGAPERRHAEVGVAGAAQVLDGGQRARRGRPSITPSLTRSPRSDCGTNRTRVPGASSAARLRGRVPQLQRRCVPIELPAARRGARVDAGVRAGQRHRAGRDRGARLGAARHGVAARAGRSGSRNRARTRRTPPGIRRRRAIRATSLAA